MKKITSLNLVRQPNGNFRLEPFEEDITAREGNVRHMSDEDVQTLVKTLSPKSPKSPSPEHMKINLTKRGKKIAAGIALFAFLLLFGVFSINRPVSAEESLRQAQELRLKARRGHCEEIGKKMATCYSGNLEMCKTLQNSISWFTDEYNEMPEIACTTVPDPLVFGDAQE